MINPIALGIDYSLRLLSQVMLEECGKDRLVDLYDAPFDDRDFYDYVHATPSGTRMEGAAIARFVAGSDLIRAWGEMIESAPLSQS